MRVQIEKSGEPGSPEPASAALARVETSLTVTDARGRVIVVRRLTPVERLRSKKVIGGINDDYYLEALPAYMVAAIDGETLIKPMNELQLEGLISRLGDEGLEAVIPAAAQLVLAPKTLEADAKN